MTPIRLTDAQSRALRTLLQGAVSAALVAGLTVLSTGDLSSKATFTAALTAAGAAGLSYLQNKLRPVTTPVLPNTEDLVEGDVHAAEALEFVDTEQVS